MPSSYQTSAPHTATERTPPTRQHCSWPLWTTIPNPGLDRSLSNRDWCPMISRWGIWLRCVRKFESRGTIRCRIDECNSFANRITFATRNVGLRAQYRWEEIFESYPRASVSSKTKRFLSNIIHDETYNRFMKNKFLINFVFPSNSPPITRLPEMQ